MPRVSEAEVATYLRTHPLPGAATPTGIRELAADFPGQRFRLTATEGASFILKRYEPAAGEAARREAAGLRLAGGMGLGPALALADDSGAALGGPVVVSEAPAGARVDGGPLAPGDVQGWLLLLLTLHHLPPSAATLPSSMSADAAAWWQRTQPAWQTVQTLYADPRCRPLVRALASLHAIVGARIEVHRGLWEGLSRRPCHGNPVPANLLRVGGRLMLVEWDGFGQGDPAMETARAAILSTLTGELDAALEERLLSEYAAGMRDLRDAGLEERLRVFASVVPLGFCFTVLGLLAQDRTAARGEREERIAQVGRALTRLRETLGVDIGNPTDLLAPVRALAGI
jgi:hypothetical protein